MVALVQVAACFGLAAVELVPGLARRPLRAHPELVRRAGLAGLEADRAALVARADVETISEIRARRLGREVESGARPPSGSETASQVGRGRDFSEGAGRGEGGWNGKDEAPGLAGPGLGESAESELDS